MNWKEVAKLTTAGFNLFSSACWLKSWITYSKFKTLNKPNANSADADKFADNSNQSERRKYRVNQSIGWNSTRL